MFMFRKRERDRERERVSERDKSSAFPQRPEYTRNKDDVNSNCDVITSSDFSLEHMHEFGNYPYTYDVHHLSWMCGGCVAAAAAVCGSGGGGGGGGGCCGGLAALRSYSYSCSVSVRVHDPRANEFQARTQESPSFPSSDDERMMNTEQGKALNDSLHYTFTQPPTCQTCRQCASPRIELILQCSSYE